MSYAIIRVGGKQYRVHEGERILVDRLSQAEGKTFHPELLLLDDNGKTDLSPKGAAVTARVVGHVLGEKIRIGKYRRRTGYRRHTGFRARLSEIEIEKIGKRQSERKASAKDEDGGGKTESRARPKASAAKEKESE
jgi:large subunit ribosomal protein L21